MKSNSFYLLLVFIMMVCFFAGCSTVKILEINQDANVNLKDYKTFNFYMMNVENETVLEPEKANLELLLQEIRNQMEVRNYKRAEDPGLMINIGIVISEDVQTRETTFSDAPVYMGQRNYHWESEEIVVGTYNEGAVTIDLVDTKKNVLVYHGVAKSVISKKTEKNKNKIKQAVQKIFKKFPF
jgi:hypothetical protein